MSDAERTFVEIATGLDYLMLVVTAGSESNPAGCLVGFSTQCSIHPPRYLVCLSQTNRTTRVAQQSDVLGVHFLGTDELALARLFGGETTDDHNTFSQVRWRPGPAGVPILEDCGRWFAGSVLHRQPFGDHIGYLLEPIEAEHRKPAEALTFQQVKELDPGHAP